jgi:hypothetical protein
MPDGASAYYSCSQNSADVFALRQISLVPKGFPVSPEGDEFTKDIRQMMMGCYVSFGRFPNLFCGKFLNHDEYCKRRGRSFNAQVA